MATYNRHFHLGLGSWLTSLVIAAVMALLCMLCACSSAPAGRKLTIGFVGSPLGIEIGYTELPPVGQSTPVGWVTTDNAVIVATQPVVQPATLPAATLNIDPATRTAGTE